MNHPRLLDRAAFTLIELLVVIAIIALLVAILLPSLAAARQNAQKVVCLSNMSQFAKAFESYSNDNNNYVLKDYAQTQQLSAPHDGYPHVFWAEKCAPYLNGPPLPLHRDSNPNGDIGRDTTPDVDGRRPMYQVFREMKMLQCPAYPERTEPLSAPPGISIPADMDDLYVQYSINAWHWEGEADLNLPPGSYPAPSDYGNSIVTQGATPKERLPNVSDVIWVIEASIDARDAACDYGFLDMWDPLTHFWWGDNPRMINGGRHRCGLPPDEIGYANCLYFDGHAASLRIKQVRVRNFSPYANPDSTVFGMP